MRKEDTLKRSGEKDRERERERRERERERERKGGKEETHTLADTRVSWIKDANMA